MKFFKPTWAKIAIAVILTIWLYIASFLYVSIHGEGDPLSDNMVQFSFLYHAWEWSPLYLLLQLFSKSLLNTLWQSQLFIFFIYPLVRFIVRYLAACVFVFFFNKLFRNKETHTQELSKKSSFS